MKKDDYYNRAKGCEKKFISLILMIIAIILLIYSCEVEDYCWDCEQIKLHNISSCNTIMKLDTITICNKTEDEIRNIEQTYTYIICDESSLMKCEMK